MADVIIQTFNYKNDYFCEAEALPNSTGTKKPRITFIGLDEKTKFHCAIAIKSIPSVRKPVLHFWEKGRWGILEVHGPADSQALYVKVNCASLAKRFGIEQKIVKDYIANHQGDVTGLVADLVEKKLDPHTLEKLGSTCQSQSDYESAISWYENAMKHGNLDVRNNLASCYHSLAESYRSGSSQDLQKAVELLEKAAKLDHAEATYNLALCYKDGKGLEKDHKKAVEYLEKAAKLNHIEAMYHLGSAYGFAASDFTVPQDFKKAAEWFEKAAQFNHPSALLSLGEVHRYGLNGAAQDREKAFQCFEKAVQFGNHKALFSLASCYELGDGVKKDRKKAEEYYKKSEELDPSELNRENVKKALTRLANTSWFGWG